MNKTELRQALKAERMSMAEAERIVKSRLIVERLKEVTDWSKVKAVHYFEPISELMEPDISGLVTWLEDNFSGIELFTPRKIGGKWEMISIQDKPAPEQFDIILVPMLGFDKRLHRIGYGGGYYDKFLASQTKASKIGVCYGSGRVEKIPNQAFDIPLNLIVTEDKSWQS